MEIKVIGNITEEEKEKCIREIKAKNPGKEITSLEIEANGEYLDCHYHFREADFERIRRITGYLVASPDISSAPSTASTTPRRPRSTTG